MIRIGRAQVNRILLLLLSQKDCKPEMGRFFLPVNPFGITLCFSWLPFSAGNKFHRNKFICHLQAGINHLHH